MNPDTAKILGEIDTFLSRNDRSSAELWAILTALRGPDNGDDLLKNTVTLHIRRSAFPLTTEVAKRPENNNRANYAVFHASAFNLNALTVRHGMSHFLRHARSACQVLGLL